MKLLTAVWDIVLYLVGVTLSDTRHSTVVTHVVQLVGRDETMVGQSPYRRLDVERMSPGEPHKLRVARHPVIGGAL